MSAVDEAAAPADLVLADRADGVLILTFNRPARLNAWTDAMEREYFAWLDRAEADPSVRAVVLTGAGRGFCAGADMDELEVVGATGSAEALGGDEFIHRKVPRHRPLWFKKPLIAAINGPAAGVGLIEALYCDRRFSTPDAKLTTAFARRGLIAEYGVAWLLPRQIGHSAAVDLLLSSRVIMGEEALRIGLVDRVVDASNLLSAAIAYAQELATFSSPASMGVIKAQILRGYETDFETAASEADDLMAASYGNGDIAEGVASYQERRPPNFAGVSYRLKA